MTDLAQTIAPKSDQLNADDLIAGPLTITVTRVSACDGGEQPIAIFFEGDGGKPFKPCKSMRRVLVQVWGRDGAAYRGRSMTLYRDPAVMFGGVAVGGIRISHMSGLDAPRTMALTATRAQRKPYTVKPLPQSTRAGTSSTPASQGAELLHDEARGGASAPQAPASFEHLHADGLACVDGEYVDAARYKAWVARVHACAGSLSQDERDKLETLRRNLRAELDGNSAASSPSHPPAAEGGALAPGHGARRAAEVSEGE